TVRDLLPCAKHLFVEATQARVSPPLAGAPERRNHDRSCENHKVFRTCAYRVALLQWRASGATQRKQPRAPCAIQPPRPAASSRPVSIQRGTGGRRAHTLRETASASQATWEGRFGGKLIPSALAPWSRVPKRRICVSCCAGATSGHASAPPTCWHV